MANVATAKQTGGGGFDFEDKVSANFLSKLLSGNYALGQTVGCLLEIAYQVRPDGWLLDDLLLTFNDGKKHHKVAVSSKSNRQITATGLPADILTDVWNQYLNIDHKLFDQNEDYLLFVVSPLGRSVMDNLTKIIQSAQTTDPATLAKRMKTAAFSQQQKTLFNSFHCPASWKKTYKLTEVDTCKLLSRILVLEFDFQNTVSKDEAAVITELQSVVRSNTQADGLRLYNRLKAIRAEIAPHGGSIDYTKLVAKIIQDYELKAQPEYQPDWDKIVALTKRKLANIPDKIGNRFVIERSSQVGRVNTALSNFRFVFLTGKSGFGKTVVVKDLAQKALDERKNVIWLDSDLLQDRGIKEAAGLSHDVFKLISSANSLGNLMIVDGADRFFKDNIIENFVPYIRELAALEMDTWKMVITCQSEDYENLLKHIYRKNIVELNSLNVEIEPVASEEILPAATHFPQLVPLFKHEHLMILLGNLKYLDLIAFHIGHSELKAENGRIGESTLIDWIWQQEVTDNGNNGYINSRFLQELAGKQANMLSAYTPVSDFRIEESGAITELKQMKLIGDTADRLYFVHDLFGDWARYKTIRSKGNDVSSFLLSLDLVSPLWGKAIRLYGIYLLEKERNASAWLTFFKSFSEADSKPKLIRILLLEAIIFSNSTYLYLEELWPEFKKDDGNLMNQFFEQFLIKATAPDPSVLKIAAAIQGITLSEVASQFRVPVYNYWFSVLGFVKKHSSELLEISRGHILKIISYWLDNVPMGSDYRTDMAKIAVDATRWLIKKRGNGVMVYGSARTAIYGPLLKSFSEQTEAVEDLALRLAGRKIDEKPADEEGLAVKPWHPIPRFGALMLPTEFAPISKADDDFRKVCLEGDALNDMMSLRPELAREIVMAVLLRDKDARESSTTPTYGIKDLHGWFPPFYTRGPFFSFLMRNERIGVELIVELTNIAARNWKNQLRDDDGTYEITLSFADGTTQTYFGDERIYFWFRDTGSAAHSLVSALMALEKHLIMRLDREENIDDIIQLILKNTESVSLLGLLSSLGRYKSQLFEGVLKPMFAEINFLHWEMMLPHGAANVEGHQMIGAIHLGVTGLKQAQEWNSMPHRRKSIQQVAQLLFFQKAEIRNYFEQVVVPGWIKLRDELEQENYVDPYLDNMIGQFNIDNYVTVQHEDHYTIEYREPEAITEKLQEVRKHSHPGGEMEGFAFRISQDIDKQKQYELAEVEEIWHKIQTVNAAKDSTIKFFNDPVANIFALVAVIFLNWEKLEAVHPDYLEWGVEKLDEATGLEQFDYRHIDSDPLDHSAISFQAMAIPILYKQRPTDAQTRRIVGNFTLKASYPVINKLFTGFGRVFLWTDPDFVRVQNLYLERCHLTHNLDITPWDTSSVDFNALLNPPLQKFIADLKEQPLTDVLVYRKTVKRSSKPKQKRKHGKYYSAYNDPGFDVHAFYKAFSAVPQVTETADTPADKFVIEFYQSLVKLLLYTWGNITKNKLPLDEYPNEFEKWVAFRFAKLMVTDIDLKLARKIWEPLMTYGNLYHKWLEEFTLQLVYANMETGRPEVLGFHWNAMIDFAFTQKNWGSDRRFHNGASLWESLLGISNVGLEIWRLGYVPIITTISKQLIKWFGKQVTNSDEIEKLCKLIKSPSIDLFLKPGITLVNLHLKFQITLDEAEVPKRFVRVPFKYANEVASMCAHLWEHRKTQLIQDEVVFTAFKEIVVYLVAQQNTTGLELQDRLLSI